jgi:hypothetical protein
MIVKEENVMKLKQLDRIEFRQRYDRLVNRLNSLTITFSYDIILITTFLFIFDIWMKIRTGNVLFLSMWIIYIKLVYIGLFVFIILDLVRIILHIKDKGNLLKEYFKVEVNR